MINLLTKKVFLVSESSMKWSQRCCEPASVLHATLAYAHILTWTTNFGLVNQREGSGWWAVGATSHPLTKGGYHFDEFMDKTWKQWMILHVHGCKNVTKFYNLFALGWAIFHDNYLTMYKLYELHICACTKTTPICAIRLSHTNLLP